MTITCHTRFRQPSKGEDQATYAKLHFGNTFGRLCFAPHSKAAEIHERGFKSQRVTEPTAKDVQSPRAGQPKSHRAGEPQSPKLESEKARDPESKRAREPASKGGREIENMGS